MRNQYGGKCYRCGEWCPAGEGHFERTGKGWRVQHAGCAINYRGTNQHFSHIQKSNNDHQKDQPE